MSRCICDDTGWPDVECPTHGLPGDTRYPPMNRHAREIVEERVYTAGTHSFTHEIRRTETAAEVQRRLYEEAKGTA